MPHRWTRKAQHQLKNEQGPSRSVDPRRGLLRPARHGWHVVLRHNSMPVAILLRGVILLRNIRRNGMVVVARRRVASHNPTGHCQDVAGEYQRFMARFPSKGRAGASVLILVDRLVTLRFTSPLRTWPMNW